MLCYQDMSTEDISSCKHEETETRSFVHAIHNAEYGSQSIFKTSYTNVLVIAVSVILPL